VAACADAVPVQHRPRVLVTGLAGPGKSTIARQLRINTHGPVIVVDLDDGFSHRCDRTTGLAVADDCPLDWTTQTWSVNIDKVAALLATADPAVPVVLVGIAGNAHLLMPLVDVTFFLDAAGPVLEQRLTSRVDNDYGKDPTELASVLAWAQGERQRWEQRGAVIVDNNDSPTAALSILSDALR